MPLKYYLKIYLSADSKVRRPDDKRESVELLVQEKLNIR
jgi:hypothetical protein